METKIKWKFYTFSGGSYDPSGPPDKVWDFHFNFFIMEIFKIKEKTYNVTGGEAVEGSTKNSKTVTYQ